MPRTVLFGTSKIFQGRRPFLESEKDSAYSLGLQRLGLETSSKAPSTTGEKESIFGRRILRPDPDASNVNSEMGYGLLKIYFVISLGWVEFPIFRPGVHPEAEGQRAFEDLKQAVIDDPVLQLPDHTFPH
ncbi:conserved hypothetical protein [Ricinus communis]|uniref:Uncharacterized protein n=1 Tax=Ricinus communis TaxID=3988 RepID=B9T0H1_RICCO|nr:conserved hypothetical protein [Ricinus communis]